MISVLDYLNINLIKPIVNIEGIFLKLFLSTVFDGQEL